jgi:hypothetical protein
VNKHSEGRVHVEGAYKTVKAVMLLHSGGSVPARLFWESHLQAGGSQEGIHI